MESANKIVINYYPEIDFIKAFAIVSVIVLHTLTFNGSKSILYTSFASYHIWQAVPLFMLILGFTFRLSIEKNHSLGKILSSRGIRLIIPLLVAYMISFLPIFIFDIHPVINWHIFVGLLPIKGMGNYFITLYIEIILYFTVFFYFVKCFNGCFVILLSVFISIIGELIAFSININDFYMYSSSVHRYILLISLGYYFYDHINDKKNNFILVLGGGSALLLYKFNISQKPIWPYSEYKSAELWGFQHFPYAFYTVVFALILIYLYKKINCKFFQKIVSVVAKSSFHIFLTQIFVFLIEVFYKINMNILYALFTVFVSLFVGSIWYKLEEMTLNWAYQKG